MGSIALVLLTGLLAFLKLSGAVALSWWVVFIPVIVPAILWALFMGIIVLVLGMGVVAALVAK